jgi:uncharacterized linocin/CFP29 family protein
MMDLLKRPLAPIVPRAWELIDAEAIRVLTQRLAGRKLVDVKGPHGWDCGAVNTGRLEMLEAQPVPDVHVGLRKVLPLLEVRAPMQLKLLELDLAARGCEGLELDVVVRAAEAVARTEDAAIFGGYAAAGITGIVPASSHEPISVEEPVNWPAMLLEGQQRLRKAGVTGPYALALGTDAYDELFAATVDGYPVAKQVQRLVLEGPIVQAPALAGGGVLMSVRGGDYELVLGQDLAVGYAIHDKESVELYLTESFTFRVLEPGAAIHFVRP